MADVESQERVHDMLLGPLERPALRWLASVALRACRLRYLLGRWR